MSRAHCDWIALGDLSNDIGEPVVSSSRANCDLINHVAHRDNLNMFSNSPRAIMNGMIQAGLGPKVVLLESRAWICFIVIEHVQKRHRVLGRNMVEEVDNDSKSEDLIPCYEICVKEKFVRFWLKFHIIWKFDSWRRLG